MALPAPIEIRTPHVIGEGIEIPEIVVQDNDLKRVRGYCRLAAAFRALALILLALFGIWISTLLFGGRWDSRQTLVLLTAALALAGLHVLLTALRVRSYHLDLTAEAVIFAFGRNRAYVPREHIQLLDTESSILLRLFGLRGCL